MSSDPEGLRRSVCSVVLDTRFGDYGNRTWMGSAEAIADAVIPLIREAVLAEVEELIRDLAERHHQRVTVHAESMWLALLQASDLVAGLRSLPEETK